MADYRLYYLDGAGKITSAEWFNAKSDDPQFSDRNALVPSAAQVVRLKLSHEPSALPDFTPSRAVLQDCGLLDSIFVA
jgi:hypothetical protein